MAVTHKIVTAVGAGFCWWCTMVLSCWWVELPIDLANMSGLVGLSALCAASVFRSNPMLIADAVFVTLAAVDFVYSPADAASGKQLLGPAMAGAAIGVAGAVYLATAKAIVSSRAGDLWESVGLAVATKVVLAYGGLWIAVKVAVHLQFADRPSVFCLAAAVVATVLLPFMAADKPAEARKGLRVTVGSSSYVPPSPRRRFPYSSADTVAATIAYDLRPEAVRARWHTQIDDLYKSLGIVKPERVDELLDTIWAGKEHELFDLIEIKYKLHKKTYGSDPDSEPDSPGEEDEVGRSFDAHAAGRSFGGMARGAEESGPRTMGKYLVVAMTLVFLVLVYDARLTIADNGLQLYLNMVVLLTGSQCGSDMTAGSSALKHMRDIYRDVPGGLTIPHPPDTQSILIPREGGGDIHVLIMTPPDFAGQAARIMSAGDVDGDGQLSLEEYNNILNPKAEDAEPEVVKQAHHSTDSAVHTHNDQYYGRTANSCWCKELTEGAPSCLVDSPAPDGSTPALGWCRVRPGCPGAIGKDSAAYEDGWDVCKQLEKADFKQPSRPPPEPENDRPLLLWLPWNNLVLGGEPSTSDVGALIASTTDIVVASIEVRLPPEHPYPAGFQDTVQAAKWILQHADDFGIDATRVGIGGVGGGASIAASFAREFPTADEPDIPTLSAQVLVNPMIKIPAVAPGSNSWASLMSPSSLASAWELYAGGDLSKTEADRVMEIVDTDGNKKIDFDEFKSFVETADMNPKSVAVARCDADVMCCAFGGEIDSSDEAPAVVLTASVDALLDEGVEYASKLEAAGNEVTWIAAIGSHFGATKYDVEAVELLVDATKKYLSGLPAAKHEASSSAIVFGD